MNYLSSMTRKLLKMMQRLLQFTSFVAWYTKTSKDQVLLQCTITLMMHYVIAHSIVLHFHFISDALGEE